MNSWTANAEVKREFGSLLRRARENQGLTIADVSEQTRIPSRYIQLLEEEAFDKLTQPFYVRNYINNLSKFYGIDPRPLLTFYESLSGYAPPNLSPDAYSSSVPVPAPAKTKAPPPVSQPQAKPASTGIKSETSPVSGPAPKTNPRRPQSTGISVNPSNTGRELSMAAWIIIGILTVVSVLGLVRLISGLSGGGFKHTTPGRAGKPPLANTVPAKAPLPETPVPKTPIAKIPAAGNGSQTGTELMERFIGHQPFPPTTIKIPTTKTPTVPAADGQASH